MIRELEYGRAEVPILQSQVPRLTSKCSSVWAWLQLRKVIRDDRLDHHECQSSRICWLVPAAAASAVTTASSTAAPTAAAAFFLGTRFVDGQLPTVNFAAIQSGDRCFSAG